MHKNLSNSKGGCVSDKTFDYLILGYAYYIVNPWRPRHDEIIRRMLEGGFINKWKEQTWYGMKMDYQEELKRTGADGIKFNIKPLVNPLAMDSFMVYSKCYKLLEQYLSHL